MICRIDVDSLSAGMERCLDNVALNVGFLPDELLPPCDCDEWNCCDDVADGDASGP
jgi:hypothetical protein